MSTIERTTQLDVGTVESVSPDDIKIALNTDAPQTTALNTGIPTSFPRINGYLLVPHESGATVGLITWMGIERSPFPKRRGLQDFGIVDLPFPQRKLALTPIGTLRRETDGYRLDRGITSFPSVGDTARLPTDNEVRAIIEPRDKDKRVIIGEALLAGNAHVGIDPDKLFGRHLAVLGNTGSGKSCSVAGLIRWSLHSATKARASAGQKGDVNARVIILDPNGEYAKAFEDFPSLRLFQVPPATPPAKDFVLPAWLWNSHEWASFSNAAPGVQRPLLMTALRALRARQDGATPDLVATALLIRHAATYFRQVKEDGVPIPKTGGKLFEVENALTSLITDAQSHAQRHQAPLRDALTKAATHAKTLYDRRHPGQYFNSPSDTELDELLQQLAAVETHLPQATPLGLASEDAPIPFRVGDLAGHLERTAHEQGHASNFIAWLVMRLKTILADPRLSPVVDPKSPVSFESWLENYIGADEAGNGPLAIIDLSLVPSDVIHTVIAVLARLVFEATQRYRRAHSVELPTVLVLEEAHTFVQRERSLPREDGAISPTTMCRSAFERIAREGRKFGLGLVLSSQRPSELSPTVLAQCNSFLLHRIVNDQDQELVGHFVPDNLGRLLQELPSLPAQHAILLGWATPVPVLVRINDLPERERPRSEDPHFWDVWTGTSKRPIDWEHMAREWQGTKSDA